MFFKSLKKEILTFALGLIIITIVITTALGVFSTQTAGRAAQKATSDTLREQAKESLIQIVESTADQQDFLFGRVKDDVSNLASYAKNIYENPSVFHNNAYWKFDSRVFLNNGRYLNSESDISTIYIPNFVTVDREIKNNLDLTATLDFIVPSILASNPNIVALYTTNKKGVARYFPNIILGNVVPPDYDTLKDVVYTQATPEQDPDKKVVWSALYNDPAERGLMITASAPIYTKNGFNGMFAADVLLNSIIKTITAYSPIVGSYAFLIDKEGSAIAFPDKAYQDILGRSRKEGEVRTSLASSSQEFSAILKEMTSGASGFGSIHNGEKELFVAYAPLKQTGFSMAIVAEQTVMLKAASALQGEISSSIQHTITNQILPASLFIILFASIISIFLVTQIVKPIRQLTLGAYEIGKGNLDYELKVNSKNEIGDLASSFTQMSQNLKQSRKELYEYSQGLEKKVKERTQELEQNNIHLLEQREALEALSNQLAVANKELKRLDQTKSEFMSIASHQLRAPLTVIKGYLSLAIEGMFGEISGPLKESLEKATFSTKQLAKLVNEFLDLSRIESGRIHYVFAVNDLNKIITDVAEEYKPQAKDKNILLRLKLDKLDQFIFDRDKMREIIINYVHNAVKYTPKGTVDIRSEIIKKTSGQFVRVSVVDQGMGIDKEDIDRIFQKFIRTEQAKISDPNGLGLGLYFVRKVAEDHGGTAWAKSEGIGKGSTFVVEIPFKQ